MIVPKSEMGQGVYTGYAQVLASADEGHQRLIKVIALAIFASDAISSTAYATEEILFVLLAAATFPETTTRGLPGRDAKWRPSSSTLRVLMAPSFPRRRHFSGEVRLTYVHRQPDAVQVGQCVHPQVLTGL